MMILYHLVLMNFLLLAQGVHQDDLDHECYRECVWPPEAKVCNYHFKVEWYTSMSKACYDCPYNLDDCHRKHCVPLNGVERPIITINRRTPGPSIHVCEGDTVNVTVTNHLANGEGTTIHWHGLHQRTSPYMDGTAYITQCPIDYATTFTYTFPADTTGTHFWHAHLGFQRQDGSYGSLVVREAKERDIHKNEYDFDLMEHSVLVLDWLDDVTLKKFIAHHHDNGDNRPEAILINGKGKRAKFVTEMGSDTLSEHFTEREVFHVRAGGRYRFRMASNAGTNCAKRISVDNHTLTVIASDGRPIKPVVVDTFVIYGGERFDFILNATQDVANYWLRAKGLADCIERQELAIVRYEGAGDYDPLVEEDFERDGFELNPLNEMESDSNMQINRVRALEPDDITLDPEKSVSTYYIAMDFNKVNNYHFHDPDYYPVEDIDTSHHLYSPQLNHISFLFPPASLLHQHNELDPSIFCDPNDVAKMRESCEKEYCECTHVIHAELGEVVELVVVDEGFTFDASHPMHLHGHSFRVVALEKIGRVTSVDEVIAMDLAGNITRNLQSAPLKDTVIVPDAGYTIIRFEANNPGWWFFHCHLEFHVEIGMSLVIHTGTDDDLQDTPADFPKCYDWPRMTTPANPTTEGPLTTSGGSLAMTLLPLHLTFVVIIYYICS
ncbi:L-ascorbate oxidase [Holothuria leucospilota]|uniref:L-ascorbate oxidase n=1 Tax=Holothuria leucospilota TaxID=206669 RepID=A0A9Q1BPH0_HOLLE|nr:L-ascorbate oxidase [Holothuria leucospilota]